MNRISAYLRLPSRLRRLLREAARELVAARRRKDAATLFGTHPGVADLASADIAWAIRTAAHHLPGTWNCLAQARAATRMLRRRGIAHEVRVGARKGEGLEAHAWVVVDGRIVVGDLPDLHEYSTFTGTWPK